MISREEHTNADPGHKCEAVGVHCAAHRLSLAASQAGDGVPYVKKFKDHPRKLYDFFDNGSVRTAGLRAVQELLDNPKLKLPQPSSTRWLSVGNAVKRLKEIFASVVVSLEREAEERDDVIAVGLHHVMTEYKFVATMLLLCDVLPTVNRLSLLFQAQWIDFSSLSKYIQSAVTKLDGMNTVDGAYLKSIDEYVHQLSQSGLEIRKLVKRGDTVDHHEVFRRSVQLPFLTQLLTNINSRFKDGDVIFPLLSVLDPKNLPNAENLQDQAMNPRNPCDDESDHPATADHANIQGTTVTSLEEHGNESIKTICARFGIEIEPTVEEWGNFKQFFLDHQRNLTLREVTHLLCSNETQRRLYPRMSKLAQICCYSITYSGL